MTSIISPVEFLSAFKTQWRENPGDDLEDTYTDNTTWTNYMLGSDPPGFLRRVACRLHKQCYGSLYTLDLVYVAGEDLFREDLTYPSLLSVLIEHENSITNTEEEMWKLIFWRSPLKVLIFYDWNEDDKTTEMRKNILEKKLKKFINMLNSANNRYAESEQTEYLFIIGNRNFAEGPIQWRWADTTLQIRHLCP